MTLQTAQRIHCIGIGGIGISAIAKWALEQGKQVSGSDLQQSTQTEWLAKHGTTIHIGQHASAHVPLDCDLVVHTVAVHPGNPEYDVALERKIPTYTYPQALNALFTGKQGIAVAGTHGKSTTTSLLAHILIEAQRDPTVVVGTRVRLFGNTNERIGNGPDVLVEADEYNQGILLFKPQHAVVLNIDHEHVDIYPTVEDVQRAFATFIGHVPRTGTVTLNADDAHTQVVQKAAQAPVRTFGLHAGDVQAHAITTIPNGQTFTVAGLYEGIITTQLYGEHNVRNILAALCVAHALHIPFATCQKAIADFPGTWRRFENRGMWKGATIIDDYAHHPTEVQATLQAARQAFPNRRIICVFQPHLRSRTAAFAREFATTLRQADAVVVVEVYDPVGRNSSDDISSRIIVQAIGSTSSYAATISDAVQKAASIVQNGDIILTMGAGDITQFSALVQKENPS